jgi:rhodanese-related sulfurtransferase
MSWKKIAWEAGLILVAGVLVGAAVNVLRPESHKLAWIQARTLVQREAAHPAPEVEQGTPSPSPGTGALFTEITPDIAFRMYGSGALFLDARRTAAYEAGHIADARSVPVWEHDAGVRIDALQRDGIPFEKDLVIYCSGAACEDSARLAEKLALAGFFKLSLYKEGFPDWEKRGWPVIQGAKP